MGKTPETKPGSRLAKTAAFSGGVAFVLGAAGLAGWVTGWRVLASIRADYFPMAPDSALLFMAFGVILFSGAYAKGRGISRSLVAAFVGLASAYGALKFAENFIRADLTFEGLLFPVTERLGTFPLGRMSPYAGLIFFACGVALLIRILGRDRANLRNTASFLGMAVLVGGGVATTGYLFGTPLLYGGHTVPLAATTAAAFLLLGIGLTVMAGAETFIVRELSGPSPSARLLRGILPAIVLAILLDGLLDTSLANALNVNKALLSAVLTLAFIVLTAIIVVRATRTIFLGAARAEAERRGAEEQLLIKESALASSMNAIGLADMEGKLIYANAAFSKLWGYDRKEEILGKSISEFALSAEWVREAIAIMKAGREYVGEGISRKRDGAEFTIKLSANLVTSPEGRPICMMASFLDVTERRRAEEELRKSETRYRLLAENMQDVVWTLDPETMHFTYVSPSVEALRGYTPEEVIARPAYDALVPEAQEALRKLIGGGIARFLAEPGGDHTETNLIGQPCKDGSTVLTEVVSRFYRDEETGKVLVHGVTRDITERTRAEEALRESETRYRSLFENMLEGVAYCRMIYDDGGRPSDFVYLAVNPAFERLTGLKGVMGRRVTEVIPGIKEQSPKLFEAYGRVASTGRPEKLEVDFKPLGIWLSISVYSPGKECFVAVFDDVTERKRAEEEIKNAQLLLKSSIESPQEMIILSIDLQYRYLYFNQWHKQVMRAAYGKDVRIGMNLLECVTSEDDRQKAKRNYDRALAGESHSTVEEYGDVERLYYESFYSPIINENGKIIGATAFARDVTDRKRAEEALRNSVKQKELLMKELQHRVKNSLALVSGLLGLGMEAVTDEQARGIISETRSRIRSVASLYEQLYGTSDPASVDLGHYFGRLAEALFKAYAPETGNVLLKTRLDEVKLDTKRAVPLGLILNELVTNTLKYAFPAGAKGEIRIDLEWSGGTVTFGVSDDGPGFPDRFDPKTSGGMGWSLVRMLAEEINGELICPAMTKGARVLIRFKP